MTLTSEDRATFLDLLPQLAPDADAGEALRFLRERREAALAELAEVPGFDQVRAGVLRALPALVEEAERGRLLAAADAVLEAYDPTSLGPLEAMRRQPAWVGLCALELAVRRGGDIGAAAERAAELATRGFAQSSPDEPLGAGEVLWALAEAAGDVGWDDLCEPLLDLASRAPFQEPENLARVRLLQVLRLLTAAPARAPAAVDALLALPVADTQTRTHALWIGAHLDRDSGRLDRAVARLEEASALVDADEEPEIVERIAAALTAIGARSEDPAEA